MFKSITSNLIICIYDEYTKSQLSLIQPEINCAHECFIYNNIKIDLKTNSCIKNCNESEYKYDLIIYIMKYAQINLIFQIIMNIYVNINLQEIITILLLIKICIKKII